MIELSKLDEIVYQSIRDGKAQIDMINDLMKAGFNSKDVRFIFSILDSYKLLEDIGLIYSVRRRYDCFDYYPSSIKHYWKQYTK